MEKDIRHYSRIGRILLFILVLNWAVAAAKIILGYLTKCQSMAADGWHSVSDGASNIIGLVGIALSARPVDADHPYGHRKYETFFSLAIAAVLFFVSINLIRESLGRFLNPVIPEVGLKSFAVMFVTMAVNFLVMKYEYRQGEVMKSDFLTADSMHTRSDIFTSISVIFALIAIRAGYPILDPIVTFIISLFIAYTGLDIIKDASRVLCDTAAIMDVKKISGIVLAVKGVRACHKIRTRGRPDDICLDLHVQVDSAMHTEDAHKICDVIEEELKKKIPGISDVLIHIEPGERRHRRRA